MCHLCSFHHYFSRLSFTDWFCWLLYNDLAQIIRCISRMCLHFATSYFMLFGDCSPLTATFSTLPLCCSRVPCVKSGVCKNLNTKRCCKRSYIIKLTIASSTLVTYYLLILCISKAANHTILFLSGWHEHIYFLFSSTSDNDVFHFCWTRTILLPPST